MESIILISILITLGYACFTYGKKMLAWDAKMNYQSKFSNHLLSFTATLLYFIMYKEDADVKKLNFFLNIVGIFVMVGTMHLSLTYRLKDSKNFDLYRKFSGPIKGVISTILGCVPIVLPHAIDNLKIKTPIFDAAAIYFCCVLIFLFTWYLFILPKSPISWVNRSGSIIGIIGWVITLVSGITNYTKDWLAPIVYATIITSVLIIVIGIVLHERVDKRARYIIKR